MAEYETVVDVRVRLRVNHLELALGELPEDAAERLVVDQLGVPIEDVLEISRLVTYYL